MTKLSSEKVQQVSGVLWPRAAYESGGWNDGRLGQAYDLLWAVVKEHGENPVKHTLLAEIETLDAELAR